VSEKTREVNPTRGVRDENSKRNRFIILLSKTP
jgi:hypothetical protein